MQPQALEHIRRLTQHLASNEDRLTIDADTHATDLARYPRRPVAHYYHGRALPAEDLVAEMDMAAVSMANTWQNPACTEYPGGEDENAESLLEANRYIAWCGRQYPDRFIPSGWTDPKACGVANACRIAEACVREFGFVLVKMNPAQNQFPIDSPDVLRVVDRIVELGAIPVFHYGADSPFTPASGLEQVALRHPEHPVVGVHMGGGGAAFMDAEELYHRSRELGLRRPNIRFIFSAKRDTHIEEALIAYQLAGPPFCHNLFCGSDAPYGRMSWNFGGFRLMFETLMDARRHPDPRIRGNPGLFDECAARNYLGGNFARMILRGYEHLLKVQQAAVAV
ncbi:MAG: amidohydrolase family protein [Bryobacteraceae bacterium]|nr:amidohydrolase family protein [Bryobacteraceae bacterium]